MKVKEITWCSDGSCEEADVIITDGQFELTCFCHPCTLKKDQEILEPLNIDLTDYTNCPDCSLKYAKHILAKHNDEIQKADVESYEVKKLEGSFNYHLTGQVIDQNNGIIRIGNILMEVGNISYHQKGEFVTFHCSRIDI